VLPSDPATRIFEAFAAVTDNVDDPPAAIVVGFAEMVTEGGFSMLLWVIPPHPTARRTEAKAQNLNERTRGRFPNRGTTDKCFLPSSTQVSRLLRQLGRNFPRMFASIVDLSHRPKENHLI
jgi:hypothetical protein